MKVLGLIVEYNPFHNGHLYHLKQARRLCNADYTVCVMSGNFIQRGEPALVNKWARARMALLSGVDLVIELPVVYAMASAEFFAFGAVRILDSLGMVDSLCFGSESGSLDELDLVADILHREPEEYKQLLKARLDKGVSYPSAREYALKACTKQFTGIEADIGTIISSSNNILGIEYLKALKKLKSNIVPKTLKRISNSYNSEYLTGTISSATSIRKMISDCDGLLNNAGLKACMPEATLNILAEEFNNGRGPVCSTSYENLMLALLRKMSLYEISALPYVSEGLENRIKAAANKSGSYSELIENIATRRYTATRIQRIIASVLTGLKDMELKNFNSHNGPQYIRVLGFNQNGRQLLTKIKKSTCLPVIVKNADFKDHPDALLKRMLEIEAFSTDMYVLGYKNPSFRAAGQEYTQNIIRIGL